MPILFTGNQGLVARVRLEGATALIGGFKLNPPLTFEERKSVITSITISESCNVRFQPSMGKAVYAYTFGGDNMGSIQISGINMLSPCDAGAIGASNADRKKQAPITDRGLGLVRKYYLSNRASVRQDPIQLVLAGSLVPLKGYLVQWTGRIVQPEFRVFEWAMLLSSLPAEDDQKDH